jgi:chromosome segregation ATPase
MRFGIGPKDRSRPALVTALLSFWIVAAPVPPSLADEEGAGAVAKQLEGIRVELQAIAGYLETLEQHQQVSMLMTRIRLKQQRLALLESQLTETRADREKIEQEIEQFEAVEQSFVSGLDRDDLSDDADVLRGELELLRQRKSNLESRLEAKRIAIIELENELMRAREDVLALEETVDERLGLR